jgi:hypothetical protein
MQERVRLPLETTEGDAVNEDRQEVSARLYGCGYRSVPGPVFDYIAEEYLHRRDAGTVVNDDDVAAIADAAIKERLGHRNVVDELNQGVCNLGTELERLRAAEITDLGGDVGIEHRRLYRAECQRDRFCQAFMVEEITRYQLDMAGDAGRNARLRTIVNVPSPNDSNTAMHASTSRHRLQMLTDLAAQMTSTLAL